MSKIMKQKKVLYIDMDGVLCDFSGAANAHPDIDKYKNRKDCIPGIFKDLKPMDGAIEAFDYLWDVFDVYILSTPPWRNPDAWIHKKEWVEKYIPKAKRRLILTHHKNLNKGDYLIDDSQYRGQADFDGEWIHFGTDKFPNWATVIIYFHNMVNKIDTPVELEYAPTPDEMSGILPEFGDPESGDDLTTPPEEAYREHMESIAKLASDSGSIDPSQMEQMLKDMSINEGNIENELEQYDKEMKTLNLEYKKLTAELSSLSKSTKNK